MRKLGLLILLVAFINIAKAADLTSWRDLDADTIMAYHLRYTGEEMEKGFKAKQSFPMHSVDWTGFSALEFLVKGGIGRNLDNVQSVDILDDVLINILEQYGLIPTEDQGSRSDIRLRHIVKHLNQNVDDLYLKNTVNLFKDNLGYRNIIYIIDGKSVLPFALGQYSKVIYKPDFSDGSRGAFSSNIDERCVPGNYKYLPDM